ncbi:MAG: hypothetical protein WA690_24190 [Candidatus Acidiferrales bacterium]
MVIATVRGPRCSISALILTSIATLAVAPRLAAQAQASNVTSSSSASPSSDAAAKAVERKKRFEEEEKRLENAESAQAVSKPEATSASADDMSISPVLVNMLVHETQGFSLFDNAGHNLTSKAEWTLSNSYVADLSTNGTPTITSKDVGTVTVYARVGSHTTEASVNVLPGDTLPIGTIRWQAPKVRNFKAKQIVIAVPSSGRTPAPSSNNSESQPPD